MSRRAAIAVTVVALVLGCARAESVAHRELMVLVASSLSAPFTDLAARFEAAHPGTTVRFHFAESSVLVAQASYGVPGDLLALTDQGLMESARDSGLLAGTQATFATDTLMIAVLPSNPQHVGGVRDLDRPGINVAMCAVEVPCGAAAAQVARAAALHPQPYGSAHGVADVLDQVRSGTAEAGLGYRSEVLAAVGVAGVEIPAPLNRIEVLPISALAAAREPGLAAEFLQLVLGSQGRQAFSDAGFGSA